MWFIGVEVEQETSAPPPEKNPGPPFPRRVVELRFGQHILCWPLILFRRWLA